MNRTRRWETALFLGGGALIVALQIVLYIHAGAIWRDEIHSVVLARMPGWLQMFHSLLNDSFPGLWVSVLRLWIDAGMGAGDWWTRLLGVVISVAIVAALWVNARWTGTSPPLLGLAFAAFNPAVFYFGSSLRAYGLAVFLVVLFFGAVWRVAEEPRPAWIAAATLLALLCANANYQDSYLIFGICAAGASVCLTRRLWKRAALILGIGLAAAVSLLPYLGVIRAYGEGGLIRQAPVQASAVWEQFSEAFDPARLVVLPIFFLLFAGVVAIIVAQRSRNRAALYGGLVIAISTAALYRFTLSSRLPTFPWHFVPFIGLGAVALDFALDTFVRGKPALQWTRFGVAAALMLICAAPLWSYWAHLRRTNMDILADDVASVAAPGDFILISPFWNCYSFKYYYKGAAKWSILPIVPDDQIDLEYNAFKPFMTERDPLAASLAKIEETLKSGGRLWVVGRMPPPRPGTLPPTIAPAPDPIHGWDNVWYMQVWAMQTNYFLQQHAVRFITAQEKRGAPVNSLERGEIAVAQGWKE